MSVSRKFTLAMQRWLWEYNSWIFHKAGKLNAHRRDTVDDPMRETKIVFAGDQLTWVQFANLTLTLINVICGWVPLR